MLKEVEQLNNDNALAQEKSEAVGLSSSCIYNEVNIEAVQQDFGTCNKLQRLQMSIKSS